VVRESNRQRGTLSVAVMRTSSIVTSPQSGSEPCRRIVADTARRARGRQDAASTRRERRV
jgi:hypothetical protein